MKIKVKVLFFANFRELLDCQSLTIEIEAASSVDDLCRLLSANGDQWTHLFGEAKTSVKVSVNQEMAGLETALNDADEVAFFPPVTGG